ncbi:MAG: TetR/AcrR family transcriptional regulator [Microbacterium sp.]|uniref:TetR/AcrR family transcriptional regulator n=1 Tax=Microbacterium sp. TaxID=51671 RepID=UPI001D93377B|nr:TetR/AcrR family transcriptional regulator [Microbacterium sp.]MBW8762699.1 TetR/AcrR family transcriptional regulator [Microbacterium sp.]
MADRYHHGSLRAQALRVAAEIVADEGPEALSLRDLARRAGVSHAAPAHHFGDRRGLFTALAAEGFEMLGDALQPSVDARDFAHTAVAYVEFATAHPGHFAVMFRPSLLDPDDAVLHEAQARAAGLLQAGFDSVPDDRIRIGREDARQASWALVHGLADLMLSGALPGADLERLTLAAARQLLGDDA